MISRRKLFAMAGSVFVCSASRVYARFRGGAFLDHAVPGVGLTVSGSPRELRLYFDIGVVAALSSVQIETSTGTAIPTSRPINDPSSQQVIIVRLGRALHPGVYLVRWHMVSVLGRSTSGTYRFTIT